MLGFGRRRRPRDGEEWIVNTRNLNIHVEKGKGTFSEIAVAQVFQAHVAIINSERQAIWQRYTAFIIANSFLASAGQSEHLALLGLFLCIAAFIVTLHGYRYFYRAEEFAYCFDWSTSTLSQINPLWNRIRSDYIWEQRRWKSATLWCAYCTIFMFAIYYAVILVLWALGKLAASTS